MNLSATGKMSVPKKMSTSSIFTTKILKGGASLSKFMPSWADSKSGPSTALSKEMAFESLNDLFSAIASFLPASWKTWTSSMTPNTKFTSNVTITCLKWKKLSTSLELFTFAALLKSVNNASRSDLEREKIQSHLTTFKDCTINMKTGWTEKSRWKKWKATFWQSTTRRKSINKK